MEELLYFPTWMLLVIPQVIQVLKQWVPVLWREILAGVIAIVATAYVIVTTDLTLLPGIQEGFILFLLLTGSRALVAGTVHVIEAQKKDVPMVASRDTVKSLALVAAVFLLILPTSISWSQDSTLVAPIVDTAKETGKLWVLLASQYAAHFFGWLYGKLKK